MGHHVADDAGLVRGFAQAGLGIIAGGADLDTRDINGRRRCEDPVIAQRPGVDQFAHGRPDDHVVKHATLIGVQRLAVSPQGCGRHTAAHGVAEHLDRSAPLVVFDDVVAFVNHPPPLIGRPLLDRISACHQRVNRSDRHETARAVKAAPQFVDVLTDAEFDSRGRPDDVVLDAKAGHCETNLSNQFSAMRDNTPWHFLILRHRTHDHSLAAAGRQHQHVIAQA